MKVGERYYRAIWTEESDPGAVMIIDQRKLPFTFEVTALRSVGDVCRAISDMAVRGAPLIGAAAAWGVWLSFLKHSGGKDCLQAVMKDAAALKATRPTAVNLAWAVDIMTGVLNDNPDARALRAAAEAITDGEAERGRQIGLNGFPLLEEIAHRKNRGTVNILTHCNAGWLACVDWGSALAPVYMAHDRGLDVHVWVDETRPRNQGSRLTAWELTNHGVPCTVITDNAGGHLMQNGMVDIIIVGCDRATATGDVANKTGTYLKALAAADNNIPFYAALPASTFDLSVSHPHEIPIEERDGDEVRLAEGVPVAGDTDSAVTVRMFGPGIQVANPAFDVTPARLVTGLITDRGICRADKESIKNLLS